MVIHIHCEKIIEKKLKQTPISDASEISIPYCFLKFIWTVSAGQQYCLSEKITQQSHLVNKVWFDVMKAVLWLECSLISYFSFITHLSSLQTRKDELIFMQKNYLGFRTSWEPMYDDIFCHPTMNPKVDHPLWM